MLALLDFIEWLTEWMNEENINRYFDSTSRTCFFILIKVPIETMTNFIYRSGFHDMTLSDPFLWIIRRIFRIMDLEELYCERRQAMNVICDFSGNLRYHINFTLYQFQYYPGYNDQLIFTYRF